MSRPAEHLDDLLSGYADGELSPDEANLVEEHLATCEECRTTVEEERALRARLRSLPLLDPPFGLYERLLRDGLPPEQKRSWLRTGVVNLVVAAAGFLLVIGLASTARPTGDVGAADVITKSASLVPNLGQLHGHKATPAETQTAAQYGVPSSLAGTYQLAGFQLADGVPQAVFTNGEQTLVVFMVPGRLDWQRLPSPRPVEVNGYPAWQVSTDDADVVLVQRGNAVVVISGPPSSTDPDLATQIDPELPTPNGIGDRVEAAGRRLLETFGLRG
jgi:anti-sigma factor RsiW